MGSVDDLVTNLKGAVQNVGKAVAAVNGVATAILNTFPRVNGSFTLSAATTTNVTQTGIHANGFPLWTPTNNAAAVLLANNGLSVASVTAGTGFSVSTGTGTPGGTETFSYVVFNPS